MSNSAAAQEPSMEEILASIRRIITDEQGDNSADAGPDQVSEVVEAIETASPISEKEDDTVSGGEPMSAEDLDALFASDEPATEEPQNETVSEDDLDALFGSGAAEVEPEPVPEPEPAADEDVMELTEAEMEPDDEDLDIVEGMDIMFAEEMPEEQPPVELAVEPEVMPEPEPVAVPKPATAQPPQVMPDVDMDEMEALVSEQAASSVSGAFANLSGMVVSSQAKSMEDLMKEMLRPMLQSWLDQNLPPLVEKMVAAEIRRLSGK